MRINYNNKEIINNKLYLHDAVFTGFNYNYEDSSISLEMNENYYKKHFKIIFHNVLKFNMTGCDFWGNSLRVDCWYANADDECILYKELETIQDSLIVLDANKQPIHLKSKLDKINQPIETTLYIISADRFTVLCEYIDFEETNLQNTSGTQGNDSSVCE